MVDNPSPIVTQAFHFTLLNACGLISLSKDNFKHTPRDIIGQYRTFILVIRYVLIRHVSKSI